MVARSGLVGARGRKLVRVVESLRAVARAWGVCGVEDEIGGEMGCDRRGNYCCFCSLVYKVV